VKDYFTPEWTAFIEEKVNPAMKLFERKLCVQEPGVNHSFNIDDDYKPVDIKDTYSENDNPFKEKSKDEMLFSTPLNVFKNIKVRKTISSHSLIRRTRRTIF
jgi:hypothetical protein